MFHPSLFMRFVPNCDLRSFELDTADHGGKVKTRLSTGYSDLKIRANLAYGHTPMTAA